MRHRVHVRPNHMVKIGDIAQVNAIDAGLKKAIEEKIIYPINMSDKNIVIIDLMKVIKTIRSIEPEVDIQTIGPSQSIVQVSFQNKMMTPIFIFVVWLLLFIGSGLAIMNFHEDVSMQAVHQKLYYLVTGTKVEKPLLLQIPYSFGLGIGMILFFNHLFRKRINEEPSPLEVEMFNYQQDLDQYVILHENDENVKKLDEH